MGAKLLQDVRQDLADVVQVCEGKKKQTNYLRTLINELVKGMVIQISTSQCSLPFVLCKLEAVMVSSLKKIAGRLALTSPFITKSTFESGNEIPVGLVWDFKLR